MQECEGFIKDADCTKDTPLMYGEPDIPIYGTGKRIIPRVEGRRDSSHFEKIFLPELLPLEEYDLVAILLSGGKDSIACYYKLLELGVPKERMEFWHHDIDGGNPERKMDWKCTQNYVKSFAEAEGVKLRLSWRVNGFFGELYRIGASEPVEWLDPDTGEVRQCRLSRNYLQCQEIKEKATELFDFLVKFAWLKIISIIPATHDFLPPPLFLFSTHSIMCRVLHPTQACLFQIAGCICKQLPVNPSSTHF